MSKLKSPLLGLGAKGTIGNVITIQERHGITFARKKPTPAYRHTLLQVYQRWLYEDYAYLWRQQSVATKQQYATAGSRYHLTGFQYWMKYHLIKMPDIVGWWKLDKGTGIIAYDSSPRGNNGVITGASPADGLIDQARFFDGLNDFIIIDPPPLLTFTQMTVLILLKTPANDGAHRLPLFWGFLTAPYGIELYSRDGATDFEIYLRNTAGIMTNSTAPYTPNTWELRGGVWDGTTLYSVRNADLLDPQASTGIVAPTAPIYMGKREPHITKLWHDGYIDNLIIFNRALDATEVARWAERRYPP